MYLSVTSGTARGRECVVAAALSSVFTEQEGVNTMQKDLSKRREAGRPHQRESVGRQGLIDATLLLLRSTVPEELTLRAIALSAGVDPALIRYYFGGKDGLLREATMHLMDLTQQQGELRIQGGDVQTMVRERIRLIVDIGQKNPHFLKLVMREIYAGEETAGEQSRAFLASTAKRGVAITATILDARPGSAVKLPDVDARFLHVALIGACTYFATAQPLFEVLFADTGGRREELAERYVDFMTDMVLRGIGVVE